MSWKFPSPPETVAITLKRIMLGESPILYASHDADDGAWQFLDDGDWEEKDAMVVGLGQVVEKFPEIESIADLKPGQFAFRHKVSDKWTRKDSML